MLCMQRLTGAVDFLAAVEHLWVVVAAVDASYKFNGVHHHNIILWLFSFEGYHQPSHCQLS